MGIDWLFLTCKGYLQNKFKKLGDISGMNKEEIISVLGQPNSESILVNGMHLLQWQKNHCHIGIVFDNHGYFIRISNQGK